MNDTRIREALENMRAAIAEDPAKARAKVVPATARLSAGLACEVTGPQGQRMLTDMPPAMGGAATAPNPGWYLRGAIASCLATAIAMRAAKLGVALNQLEVTVESDSDLRGLLGLDPTVPSGQTALRTVVKIGGTADPQALRDMVTWAEGHSPVGCTIQEGPPSSLEVQVL